MKNKAKEFVGLVRDNRMLDAKKVFEQVMQTKMVNHVSALRKTVAENLFAKK